MDVYSSIFIENIVVPVYDTDPPSGSLTSPGLIWYNTTAGSLRYTYNVTGSDTLYCVKSVSFT